jgi:hypothetical protein
MKKILIAASLATSFAIGSAQAEVNFATDILPILRDNCIKCHGAEKDKGDLRLHTQEEAHKFSIVPGKPDDSELYLRVILPADDDDIMPPKGDPLTKDQTDLLKKWIEEGGKFTGIDAISEDTKVAGEAEAAEPEAAASEAAFDFNSDIRPILDSLAPEQRAALMAWAAAGAPVPALKAAEPQLVEAEVTEAETAALDKLREQGVLAMRVAQNVKWVQANFRLVGDKITDEHVAPVADIRNLTDLDLSKTGITDDGLAHIKNLTNLTRLNLNNTAITDSGLNHLAGLTNLVYLNLYGTSVSDKGLEVLKGIPTLQKLYLWQTSVTDEGAAALKAELPWLYINRGIELAAVAAPVEEEKKEEPAPQAEKKAEEPKKEAASPAPAGPTIADVLLFLTAAEQPQAEPAASQDKVAEVNTETDKPQASGPAISEVLLFLSADAQPAAAAEAEKPASAPAAGGPSISDVLLFISQNENTAAPQQVADASASAELSIAEVLLKVN